MMNNHLFHIGGFYIGIAFEGEANGMHLLPSFAPFATNTDSASLPVSGKPLLHLTVDDSLKPIDKAKRKRIREVDTGNGITIVDKLSDGGYQFIIKDVNGGDCCLLISNKNFAQCRCALNGNHIMRSFGLNNALMLAYAFATARYDTVLIHASLVRQHGYGYAFVAKSGTGKSTQVAMWLRHLPDCDLMNDDNPIVRIENDEAFIYGSPWSGKTPCYRNVKARLGAITQIVRASENSVEPLDTLQAFATLLTSVSSMKWDEYIYENICSTLGKLIEATPIYALHCLPDKESAEICNQTIRRA